MSLPWQFLLLMLAGWVNRAQQEAIEYLKEENRILESRLSGRRIRFTDAERRRLARKGRALSRRALNEVAGIVTPDTILRWHRQLVANKYDGSKRRGPGRPNVIQRTRSLVVRMAAENRSWGCTRIQGALKNVGHVVGRTTVKRILIESGLAPAPVRSRRMSWKVFLKAHWVGLAAMDFLTVEAVMPAGLVRYYVLFAIELRTRRVKICGIVHQPHGEWMKQIGRNLTDAIAGFLVGKTLLLYDRDPLFTKDFVALLRDAGVEPCACRREAQS